MLLYRGQNTDTPFEPTSSRLDSLGGDNGAVYFLGFNRRNAALSYALTNYNVFENNDYFDEENEWVDEGVFYKCQYRDSNPTMLNDISASSIKHSLPQVYEILNELDDMLFAGKNEFIEYAHNLDSALDLIECINEIRNDYNLSKQEFDRLIDPILNECGTSIAIAREDGENLNDEYLVYRTSDVQKLKVVPVYRKDIDRGQTLSERLKMSIEQVTKDDQSYVDKTVLGR